MELRSISYKRYGQSDISAYSDCYVEHFSKVLCLSLVGHDSAVKALAAVILEKKGRNSYDQSLRVDIPGKEYPDSLYRFSNDSHYRAISSKLGNGLIHTVIASAKFFEQEVEENVVPEQLVFIRPDEIAADMLYEQVLRKMTTPLLPEWRERIYSELIESGHAKLFEGFNGSALAVKISEAKLDEIVSRLVQEGELIWIQ
jgi:hypothetical protein